VRRWGHRRGTATPIASTEEEVAQAALGNAVIRGPEERGGHAVYGTVHAFKGLEAPAVVVTDLDEVSGPAAEALFYIAVTRPTERLVLVLPDSARTALARSLTGSPAVEDGARA
jgi:superfamily I DNA/RNA helicase